VSPSRITWSAFVYFSAAMCVASVVRTQEKASCSPTPVLAANSVDRQNQTHTATTTSAVSAFPEDDVRSFHSVCV